MAGYLLKSFWRQHKIMKNLKYIYISALMNHCEYQQEHVTSQ